MNVYVIPRSDEEEDEGEPCGDQIEKHDRAAHDEPRSKVDAVVRIVYPTHQNGSMPFSNTRSQ